MREAPVTPVTRVAVVVPHPVSLFELAVPCTVFEPPRYELTLCAADSEHGPGEGRARGGLRLAAEHGLAAVRTADLVVVPAQAVVGREPPAALLDALRTAHARGARIASLCTGAFVLAAAGLLDGRIAATHWMHAAELSRRHPRVRVDERALYVDDGSVLTSAGRAAAIDLCLHILRRDHGTAVAAETGRRMVVAPHREGDQAQYVPAQRAPDSYGPAADGLAPVLDWAVARLHQPLTLAQLASRAGVSPRTFGRHFVRQVGTTPLKWLNQQRMARARELLETTDLPVDSVAVHSGLGTGDGLRQHFRRTLGTTPAAYRRTFRAVSAGAGPGGNAGAGAEADAGAGPGARPVGGAHADPVARATA